MRAIRHATPERSSNLPDSAGADPAMKAGGLRTRGAAVSSLALQHRLLFDRNPQPMMVYDLDTLRLVAVSDAAVATYGYSRSEFLNLTLFDIAPPEDRALVEEILPRPDGSRPRPGLRALQQLRHVLKDGSMIDVEITADDLDFGGRPCRIAICQDVTARNRAAAELVEAREQLRRSAEEYRLLFERNPQPLFAYDCDTLEIVAASDAAMLTSGYSREEFLSMTLLEIAPEEDHAGMLEYARAYAGQGRTGLQVARPRRHRNKDGSIVDVEVTSDDVVLRGRRCRVCLAIDVTERNRVSAELALARDEAVEASNMKSAFLANMSHEIRTPMNGVIGMTEVLLDMELTQEQRECAEQIARSGEQMLSIINDILDISKIETGRLELDVGDFDLRSAITATIAVSALPARAKGLQVDLEIADELPSRVRGDSRRLHQVLLNLVANAVKFTTSGGVSVRVTAAADRPTDAQVVQRMRFEVTDTGIGIDPARLDQMFDPFTQADASTTRQYGGTGLGLAIARELVELMGGEISAKSDPGAGSTFWFEIPLAAPRAALVGAAAPAPASDASTGPSASWSRPPLVLVAEDSPINQIVASHALERCGCHVQVVPDGRAALRALRTKRFDAVLMDCQMPGLDGYQTTIALREDERVNGTHTPVIAMTAQAMDGDRESCLAAGMDDYITKPLRRAELVEVLDRWIPETPAAVD
jgi:PAS domain S-box-containing protein